MPVSTPQLLTSNPEKSNPAAPPAIDSSGAAFATWSRSRPDGASDPPFAPATASQEIRDVALQMRKARLARIVRGVVVTCAIVCVAGLVSKVARAVGSDDAEAPVASVHAGSAGRDLPGTVDKIAASIDSLSARTLHAMHVDEHRAAARVKKASRSRYTW